jgi:transcriptional regulator with XRE-family HTH domain
MGITQEVLARESGLRSKGTLSKIEAGHQLATVSVLDLLARRLGVELLDLFVLPRARRPRHTLIDATRGCSASALRAALKTLTRPADPCALPFAEASRPAADDPPVVVPLLGLDVVAHDLDAARADRGTRWVRPFTKRRLHRGCIVVRVAGRSMEPTLADGVWAIFSRQLSADPRGKVVIAQYDGLVDADTGASYTIKRFRGLAASRGSEGRWREVHLEPDNPTFEPIIVGNENLASLSIRAELVEVLGDESGA